MIVRLFRDAAAPTTLSGILGGDGTPKPADISATPTAEEIAAKEAADKAAADKAAADKLAADKLAADKLAANAVGDTGDTGDGTDAGEGGDTPPEDFFAEVEKITGTKYKVNYGNIDPISPEGVAMRERVVREQGAIEFENYLRETDPRAYAYFLHRSQGGSDDEFLGVGNAGFSLPAESELESTEVQERVYRYALKAKGNDPDAIDTLVQKAITDNKLKDKASASWKDISTAQKAQLDRLAAQTAANNKVYSDSVAAIKDQIDKTTLSYIVPDTEKAAFNKFVVDHLQYDPDTKKFMLVQEFGGDTKLLMEALLLQYKKGDLSKLARNIAKTQAVQTLRLKTKGSKAPGASAEGDDKDHGTYVPLGRIV